MLKLKYFLKEKRMLIIVMLIILICSIAIAFGIYAQITNRGTIGKKTEEKDDNYDDLKSNFQEIFTNTINIEATSNLNINYDELVYLKYKTQREEEGKYSIDAKIPGFREDNEVLQNINKEIYDTLAKEIIKIVNNSSEYSTYNVDYVVYVNDNIVSVAIMCKYKKGINPQRKILQTYNYDVKNNKLVTIDDIINYANLNKEDMQKKVETEIKKVNSQMKNINNQGYNVYLRDEKSDMYEIDKTPNFFLGKNNYLYLIYAYGNNNYTSEMDLVIF